MANGYIRLKIAKTTAYHGRVLVPDEELTVNAQEADKLVERKLAEVIGEEPEQGSDEESEQGAGDELDSMTVDELKEYAQEADIDLKGVTKKADIIAAIREAM